MKLTFLGTRSSETTTSETHQRHSALLVESGEVRLLLDCGRDWKDALTQLAPTSVLLTHAHDDHAGGLSLPYPCPVHASKDCWKSLTQQGLSIDQILEPEDLPPVFGSLTVCPFTVEHSLRAPALGLRVSDATDSFVYLPDVANLTDPRQTLLGARLYIGDGTTFGNELTRTEAGISCGHASIVRQLVWAARAGVQQIFFTHCGSTILADERRAERTLKGLAARLGLHAAFARDGLQLMRGEGPGSGVFKQVEAGQVVA